MGQVYFWSSLFVFIMLTLVADGSEITLNGNANGRYFQFSGSPSRVQMQCMNWLAQNFTQPPAKISLTSPSSGEKIIRGKENLPFVSNSEICQTLKQFVRLEEWEENVTHHKIKVTGLVNQTPIRISANNTREFKKACLAIVSRLIKAKPIYKIDVSVNKSPNYQLEFNDHPLGHTLHACQNMARIIQQEMNSGDKLQCGRYAHGETWFVPADKHTVKLPCPSNQEGHIARLQQDHIQFICLNGRRKESGYREENKLISESNHCQLKVDVSCGNRETGETWFEKLGTVSETHSCLAAGVIEQVYEKEVQFVCEAFGKRFTGITRRGELLKEEKYCGKTLFGKPVAQSL